ncbi:patatin-like phospholipase family protein [Rhizobium cauense]|uniref:patatin-like phospholipase family protein n=1 Tax=Rhizobium cauense TaxID=1166683 RepID=UPI001C6E9F61|nr:patatin-like phospholipase family protein [Rhizobium cauense]MBW9116505.1 patatin-like phospholipase family protein [Rhizobium cauense]
MPPEPHSMSRSARSDREPVPIDLALQGGGAHGAFTWGVIERILEEPWISVSSITGTSAGAMNAVVLAHGYAVGGREGAKVALETFWQEVSKAARFSPFQRTAFDVITGNWSLDNSPAYLFFDLISRLFSPYEVNPGNINPLRDILEECVDFDVVKRSPIKLFINATNVRTGLPRVFRNADLTANAVLASACLPMMHQAIEIDGDPYWDGGFSGNPLLTPAVRESPARDILLVQVNPVERPGVPRTAREILNRMNEISFNSSLKKELRAMAVLKKMLSDNGVEPAQIPWAKEWTSMRLHRIATPPTMVEMSASSKMNGEWGFLSMLHQEGRAAADEFLARHGVDIGTRETFEIESLLDTLLQ